MSPSNSASARRSSWLSTFETASAFMLLAWLICAVFPTPPDVVGTGLDQSWMWAINMAHRKNLVWGRDLIFTYGPFGYLTTPIFPEAGWVSVFCYEVARFGLTAAVLISLQRFVRPFWAGIFTVALFGLTTVLVSPFRRDQWEFAALGFALVAFATLPRPSLSIAVIFSLISAFSLFTKFNIGVEVTALLVFYLVALLVNKSVARSKRLQVVSLAIVTLLLGLILLFHLSGGSISLLPSYFSRTLSMSAAYPEGMQVAGKPRRIYAALIQIGLMAIAVVFAKQRSSLLVGILPAAALTFFLLKEGVVRHDSIVLILKLVVPVLILFVLAKAVRDRIIFALLGCSAFFLGIRVYKATRPAFIEAGYHRLTDIDTASLVRAFVHFRDTAQDIETASIQGLKPRLLDSETLKAIGTKSVDVVPQYQDYVRANRLTWAPRPSFQSYFTMAPVLDQANVDHLLSTGSAQKIIFGWETIDDRNRLCDDPLTTFTVLNWYEPELSRPDYFLLSRRGTPRFSNKIDAGQSTINWGEAARIPDTDGNELVLMDAEIGKSVAGAAMNFLFKIPVIYLDAELRSGARVRGRIIRVNLSNVIANYWPKTLEESKVLFGQETTTKPDKVLSLSFSTSQPAYYTPFIRVHWYKVRRLDLQ